MNIQTNLADLKVGDRAKVLGFKSGNLDYQQRLLEMGLVPDTELLVVRAAPLGDPIEIRIHHFSLCIRRQEGSILNLVRIAKI